MSTRTEQRAQEREDRRCQLCSRVRRLENLVYAEYCSADGRGAGGGRVCLGCVRDLPYSLMVNGYLWPLVFKAP